MTQSDDEPGGPQAFEMWERTPHDGMAGLVTRIVGYRELTPGHFRQVEPASLDIPLVINFGEPFAIGLGRAPGDNDRFGSFTSGLFAGPVTIDSFGASNCLQINFTPLGARRFFGLPMNELADRMVTLDDALGAEGMLCAKSWAMPRTGSGVSTSRSACCSHASARHIRDRRRWTGPTIASRPAADGCASLPLPKGSAGAASTWRNSSLARLGLGQNRWRASPG